MLWLLDSNRAFPHHLCFAARRVTGLAIEQASQLRDMLKEIAQTTLILLVLDSLMIIPFWDWFEQNIVRSTRPATSPPVKPTQTKRLTAQRSPHLVFRLKPARSH